MSFGKMSEVSDIEKLYGKENNKMMKPAKNSLDLGVIVSDIKASLNFYQDILGLEFIDSVPLWFGTMYRLRFGTSDVKLIEPKAVPPKGAAGLENQLGFRYMTFLVGNLSELCAELKDRGIEFAFPEKEIRPGTRIAMVKDPDGNVVEFVEKS